MYTWESTLPWKQLPLGLLLLGVHFTALADAQKVRNKAEKWLKQQQVKSLMAKVMDHEVDPTDSMAT